MSNLNEKSVELSCEHAFEYLKTLGKTAWDKYPVGSLNRYLEHQLVTMVFYNMVYKFGSDASGYCENGSEKTGTDDHWLSPRMGCYAIMNTKRDILDNYEEFKKFFLLLRSTIKITKSKNDTDEIKFVNDFKTGIVVKNLTIDKYDLIVDRWTLVEGIGKNKTIKDIDPKIGFPLKHLIPEFFTIEEKKYHTPSGTLEKFV